jgi:transposase InsO family protein
MYKLISDHVRSCVKCIVKKIPRVKKAGLMQSIEAKHPFDIVGVNILGPLPMTVRRYWYILVFTDYFTKFPICYRLKDIGAVTVARKLLKVLLEYGPTTRLVSDRGSQFMSEIFTAIGQAAGIKHTPSTAYHPQTNGLTERFNHTLSVMLSVYVHDNQSDWDLYLPFVQYAYRDTRHTSTGYSPFELLRTYRPMSLVEFKFPDVSWEVLTNNPKGFESQKERIRDMHTDVALRLKIARERQTEYYNSDRRKVTYKIGDRVWFYWPARGVDAPKLKLSLPWSGPY